MLQYSKRQLEIFGLTIEYISNLEEVGRMKMGIKIIFAFFFIGLNLI